MTHFYNLYGVVTLKIRSRSPKSFKSLNYANVTIYEVWPESAFGLSNTVQTSFFGQNLKISKCRCDLENEVKVTKI